ncbi:DNA repair protein rad50 [Entophlyctis luteolus]|nr:DNA repair protein rad50 [Entophlyctis luteolus]
MVSITSKCAELDAAIPEQLGVSRAILDSVIFCHQEESFWPLSEPATLKKRFDEIFASTRYTKALASIKDLRKDQAVQIKIDQGELNHLKADKERADTLTSNFVRKLHRDKRDIQERITAAKSRKLELENGEIAEVSNQLRHLEREQQKLQDLYSEIQTREIRRNMLQNSLQEMRRTIEIYEDTDEQLKAMLSQYEDSIEVQQEELHKLTESSTALTKQIVAIENEISALLITKGQLQAELDAHARKVDQADDMVSTIAKQANIRGFSVPLNDQDLHRFVTTLTDHMTAQQRKLDAAKSDAQTESSIISARLQKVQGGLASQQETKKMLKERMDLNQRKIRDITAKMQSLQVTQSELAELKAKITQEEEYIAQLSRCNTAAEYESKLQKLNHEVSVKERLFAQLSAEVAALNTQSESRAKLGLKIQEKKRKQEAFGSLFDSFKTEFRKLFHSDADLTTCSAIIAAQHRNKDAELAKKKMELDAKSKEISALEAKISMSKTRLQNLSKEVDSKSKAINEACGGTDFLHSVEEAEQDYHDELNAEQTINAGMVMLNKYMRIFNRDKCCPLCVRAFPSESEAQTFLKRLNDSLGKIPNKAAQAAIVADKAARLKQLTALKPSFHEVAKIRDTEIPATKAEQRKFDAARADLASVVEDLEADCAVLAAEIDGIADLRRVCDDVLKTDADLAAVHAEVQALESDKTGSVDGERMQSDVQAEINAVNIALADLRHDITRVNAERFNNQNTIASHEKSLQNAKQDLQSKTHLWNQREELQSTIAELKKEIEKFSKDIEVADAAIAQLGPSIRAIEQEMAAARDKASREESSFTKSIQELRGHIATVNNHRNEVERYIQADVPGKLEKCVRQISKLRADVGGMQAKKDEAAERILAIQKSESEVAGIRRAISDNLKYREQMKLMKEVEKEIAEYQKEAEKFDKATVQAQRKKLTAKYEKLCEELAGLAGELKQMEEQFNRIERDLTKDFADIVEKHQKQIIKLKTESLAVQDLEKYSKALESAIMRYHTMKMEEINKIIRELWVNTYRGNDIETIEIRSDNENSAKNRSYNYRVSQIPGLSIVTCYEQVVMIKEQTELDMRGRCSAGQKVLACLIIRLALAETFCLNCGILALDEPTTNLDRDNSEALAESLSNIIKLRRAQKNFQLIIITHDEEFMAQIGHHEYADFYWRVSKDALQHSTIERQNIQ